MLSLYVEILKHLLVEEIYPAEAADLCCSICPGDKGILLKFNGFNQKLPVSLMKFKVTLHFTNSGFEILLNVRITLINNN
jgi:secreted Zn-dependent insulinase-like peptidase